MQVRCNANLISTLLMSLCLITFVPGSVLFAATWRQDYFDLPALKEQNLLMPLGFYSLGLVMIGLIVLWTGYRKKERWAWFVMLIITFFYVFPSNTLTLLLEIPTPGFKWEYLWNGIRNGSHASIGTAVGVLSFLVMLVSLLLTIKEFFFPSVDSKA